jgi:hypothetical protein
MSKTFFLSGSPLDLFYRVLGVSLHDEFKNTTKNMPLEVLEEKNCVAFGAPDSKKGAYKGHSKKK